PEPHPRQRECRGHADQHGDRHHEDRDERRVPEERQELVRRQQPDVIRKRRMEYPPRIRCRRNLGAAFQRSDQHVERRHQREDREQGEEEVRPSQRPGAVAAHAAIFDRTAWRGLVDHHSACHQASFPRLLISRRMKIAAIARIGTMNSETLAPSGISLPSMPIRKAQVAKMWVWSSGPPVVRIRTMSKFANVTMRENSAVMAMMLRIIGRVTYQMRCHQLAPSMAAAS